MQAAGSGSALDEALSQVAGELDEPDGDLADLAALLAALGRESPAERRLAVRIVREVAAYAARRRPRG